MRKILLMLLVLLTSFSLISCNENNKEETPEGNGGGVTPEEDYIPVSIADAIMMANSVGENLTSIKLCVTGKISSISNAEYGNMVITDGENSIAIYGLVGKNNVLYKDLDDKPVKGDEITIYGPVHCFNGTPEFKNAVLLSFTHIEPSVDASYIAADVETVRNAEKGEKFIIEGVVAQITYANGQVPNGFYVVDETGSIYLYGDDAQTVKVGDTVKVAGVKDYYILEKEQADAEKHGYKGSCQLKDLVLLDKKSNNSDWNKTWVAETTIKEILDTPVTENVTSTIYKVNALVKKVPGEGFVNYYFFDIDNKTSSYAYTQCNGSDYSWIDKFDGKICTVYISPLNCKSSTSDCYFRFVPILIKDDNYKFDLTKACDYALKYEVLNQFNNEYTSNPMLEVITTVSNELIGVEGVEISYSSSDTNVVYFENVDGKVVMNTKNLGNATVSITATYNSNTGINVTKTETIEIAVKPGKQFETITVAEAIAAEEETIVTVEGIVVSSLVNKVGFYISDETGIIAVTCTSAALEDIQLGNKVVVQGRRIHHKKADKTHAGQSVIFDAEILANYYGSHEYDTTKFDTTKTLKELSAFDVNLDFSTTVYVVNVVVVFEKTNYYSKCSLTSSDGGSISLYCSSANQYSWLEQYNGCEVSMELALCNWNDKTYYTGCVISVTYNGVKTLNNLNFEN